MDPRISYPIPANSLQPPAAGYPLSQRQPVNAAEAIPLPLGQFSPFYGVGASLPTVPVVSPQLGAPTVPAPQPGQIAPAVSAPQPGQIAPAAAPTALRRATVPVVGPTLANAAALDLPNLPNFLTGGVASPGVPAPAYRPTPGPGAGGYSPVQNTPGVGINPYKMYARPESGGLDANYTSPQGSATIVGGTGVAAGNDAYRPGQNAVGLTFAPGPRGQGTLSALSGPDSEQQAAPAQTVAGIERAIAALQSLREARNPGVTTGGAGAFGPLVSIGSAGQGFGDDVMARDRAGRTLSSSPYDTPRTQRANALANAELRVGAGAEQIAGRAEQANRFEAMYGPALQRQAARQAEMEKLDQAASSEREKRLAEASQQGFENDLALRGHDLKTAEYLQRVGQNRAEAAAKGRGQYAADTAKASIEIRKAELAAQAARPGITPEQKQAIYEELSKLPGGNANAFNIMGQ